MRYIHFFLALILNFFLILREKNVLFIIFQNYNLTNYSTFYTYFNIVLLIIFLDDNFHKNTSMENELEVNEISIML